MSITKKLDVTFNECFIKKTSILISLSHSNIIKYFFSINFKNNENRQKIEEYDTNKKLHLEMELMQISLGDMLKEKNE